MGLFWPRHVDRTPSRAARLGRLAHYASLAAAAYVLWVLYDYTAGAPSNLRIDPSTAGLGFLLVLAILLCGRGIRWVFAGE